MNLKSNVTRSVFALMAVLLLAGICFVSGGAMTASAQVSGGSNKAPSSSHEMVDINTATKQQLAELPGIGPTYAQKIINGRPYARKNELLQKKILPDTVYDRISGMIVAKHGR